MTEESRTFLFKSPQKERLDIFLTACLPEFSRARVQALIKDGFVQIGESVVEKTAMMLEPGVVITVLIPPLLPGGLEKENIPLNVIFENPDVLIVNKPAGMVVHPSPGHDHGTLVNAALGHIPDLAGIGGEERPGIVHRLDKETSGLILIAKNDLSLRWLQEQFKSRKVKKIYVALVDGKPPTPRGRVEAPIGRNTSHRKLMAVVTPEKGREAISVYQTLENFPTHTYLEIHPLTGRTHQIRVHMAFLGCPVAGDTLYGRKHSTIRLERHFLHAMSITIVLPGQKEPETFKADLPAELVDILSAMRSNSAGIKP